ncbi:MAG: N-acetylmuramoyl-L-alanine amidase [Candidatus Bipolaricaulota bacterium]|nr:N-acetylmuramoyl-L-alanine amidase [Candidatus Bipolaricaulota bacterium]MDW8152067.1 N-acetylmuramoyl-L-alanine amidase [Candidatus Bipolaricaulota bacterium]
MERWALFLVLLFAASLALVALVSPPREEAAVVVALDAGHGGHDPGAVVAGVREKDINLALALLVRAKAQGKGLRVVLTRSTDVYVDLLERVRGAESAGARLYVSLHANYHRDARVCGVETWVDTHAGEESLRLAECLQRAVVAATGAADRGVLRQTLYLRHTTLPAALLEVGYLSCPAEREKLLDPRYRERLAEGILWGILEYLRQAAPR